MMNVTPMPTVGMCSSMMWKPEETSVVVTVSVADEEEGIVWAGGLVCEAPMRQASCVKEKKKRKSYLKDQVGLAF